MKNSNEWDTEPIPEIEPFRLEDRWQHFPPSSHGDTSPTGEGTFHPSLGYTQREKKYTKTHEVKKMSLSKLKNEMKNEVKKCGICERDTSDGWSINGAVVGDHFAVEGCKVCCENVNRIVVIRNRSKLAENPDEGGL